MTLDRKELLTVLKGGKPDKPPEDPEDLYYYTPEGYKTDMGYEVLRRAEVAGTPLEVRQVDGRWELFAAKDTLPFDLKVRCREFRDPIIRAVWMKTSLDYLSQRGVEYVPLDVAEDVQASYEDDTLDEFRDTLRGWVGALIKEAS